MVTTSTAAAIANNTNMLIYNKNEGMGITSVVSNGGDSRSNESLTSCNTVATLEQYRLQLYNYALSMESLRGPTYTAAAAMAAAAAYASTTTVSTRTADSSALHDSNYLTTRQGQGPLPTPSSYLCATTADMNRSPSALTQCATGNRLALASMSLFPQRVFQPEEPKPQHSYIGLIAMAILSSTEAKLVLSDIYQYILDNYSYFRTRGPGWRNSIRHNLSLNDCFIKSGRSVNGKGHYWAIHPANMEDFRKGDFRRRKAQRKVRKHMGLVVDDNGTDSPSPPPVMDLKSPSLSSFQHIVMGSSTITPLTTAAQHLAAHSFGWRFTQHHHRQQHQHLQSTTRTANNTTSSYMGQIFTYRPQKYAGAALCHSGNSQQHHQHQQLLAATSQNHSDQVSMLQPTSLVSANANVQPDVFSELFSQKHKRQFDVASLLAPDHLTKRELHKQQFIRKHTCESETVHVRLSTPCDDEIVYASQTTSDLDIEDIDVVDASEDEDVEADYDNDVELDSNSNSQSRSRSASHSHNDEDDDAEYIPKLNSEHNLNLKSSNHCQISKVNITQFETVIRLHDYEADGIDEEINEHEGDDEYENEHENTESQLSLATHLNNNNNNNGDNNNTNDNISNSSKIQTESNFSNDNKTISYTFKHSSSQPQTQTTQQHTVKLNSPSQTADLFDPSQPLEHTNHLHHPSHLCSHQQQPINAEAHNLFGRYYGTYMAAAAAAKINTSMSSD